MNEAQTRIDLIDPALRKAGWGVVEDSRIVVEFPITDGRLIGQGRRGSILKADYILEYKGRRLAVIEAKARDVYYTDGVAQAKDYAERLNIRFTYSTNGQRIYQIDMEDAIESEITAYPTPEILWEKVHPTPIEDEEKEKFDWERRFDEVPFERFKGKYLPRYYQRNAAINVLDGIAQGKDRLLLTMATGTGKTATAFHICWKLFHAKWCLQRDASRRPRILFLADRNILADQAFNSFNDFDDDALVRIKPSEIKKKNKVPTNGSIFFTIFQTFMSGGNSKNGELAEPYFGEYPEDFFDFIIIDECHRGGAKDESSWRAIMEYFSPAVQLGLTATPKRDVNGDTYKYFGEPVYEYSLKEGINDGFLSPFRVKEFATTGDQYQFTADDEVLEGEIDESKTYTKEEQNRIIEIMDIEKYRVKLFMDEMDQSQKTLVFCATQIHAAAVRDLINQYADSKNPNYCHRVTADDGKLGEQHLRDFQDNEKSIPTILTTSSKLSTGVDAPELRNIVLLRPVRSMVEFKQIVGRGTRLFEGKDYFTIYDFMDAHDHFQDPQWDGPPIDPPEPKLKKVTEPKEEYGEVVTYCEECKNDPCVCEKPPKRLIRVKLSDQKVRELDSMVKTSFWSPDGHPISAEEFIQSLFGDLTKMMSEAELRKAWSTPGTRKKLLEELSERGYTEAQLEDLRKMLHGEDSDVYDVLTHIAYHRTLVPRLTRAEKAKIHLNSYSPAQQEFLDFVLDQYVKEGVSELDDAKLPDLLELKYEAIADAKAVLGDIKSIRDTFIGFQGYLYEGEVG